MLIDRSPASVFAAVLWSMSRIRSFRELLATGQAECEALVDAMTAAAPQAGAPVRVADNRGDEAVVSFSEKRMASAADHGVIAGASYLDQRWRGSWLFHDR